MNRKPTLYFFVLCGLIWGQYSYAAEIFEEKFTAFFQKSIKAFKEHQEFDGFLDEIERYTLGKMPTLKLIKDCCALEEDSVKLSFLFSKYMLRTNLELSHSGEFQKMSYLAPNGWSCVLSAPEASNELLQPKLDIRVDYGFFVRHVSIGVLSESGPSNCGMLQISDEDTCKAIDEVCKNTCSLVVDYDNTHHLVLQGSVQRCNGTPLLFDVFWNLNRCCMDFLYEGYCNRYRVSGCCALQYCGFTPPANLSTNPPNNFILDIQHLMLGHLQNQTAQVARIFYFWPNKNNEEKYGVLSLRVAFEEKNQLSLYLQDMHTLRRQYLFVAPSHLDDDPQEDICWDVEGSAVKLTLDFVEVILGSSHLLPQFPSIQIKSHNTDAESVLYELILHPKTVLRFHEDSDSRASMLLSHSNHVKWPLVCGVTKKRPRTPFTLQYALSNHTLDAPPALSALVQNEEYSNSFSVFDIKLLPNICLSRLLFHYIDDGAVLSLDIRSQEDNLSLGGRITMRIKEERKIGIDLTILPFVVAEYNLSILEKGDIALNERFFQKINNGGAFTFSSNGDEQPITIQWPARYLEVISRPQKLCFVQTGDEGHKISFYGVSTPAIHYLFWWYRGASFYRVLCKAPNYVKWFVKQAPLTLQMQIINADDVLSTVVVKPQGEDICFVGDDHAVILPNQPLCLQSMPDPVCITDGVVGKWACPRATVHLSAAPSFGAR